MKKKIFTRLLIGFLAGAAGGHLISFMMSIFGGGPLYVISDELEAKTGLLLGIVLQTVLAGLYGAICVGGTLLYDIDSWSLLRATVVHYLSIMISFTAVSLILCWLSFDIIVFLIIWGTFTAVFAIIWLIMYIKWKIDVRKMNRELESFQSENKKDK